MGLFICPEGLIDRGEIRLAMDCEIELRVFMEFRGRENQIMAGIIVGPAGVPLCPHCDFTGSYALTSLPYLKGFPWREGQIEGLRETELPQPET
jgi:hypothetical protein